MTKKEEFKEFVKTKPELVDYVAKGKMTWQKFYEMYDLYGSDRSVWDKFNTTADKVNQASMAKLGDLLKNVDMDSVQNHINTAQKAIGFIQELTGKTTPLASSTKATPPRPINKFFED